MARKISDDLLKEVIAFCDGTGTNSLTACAKKAGLKAPTLTAWHANLKSGKWAAGYSKTSDEQPLCADTIAAFLDCFAFVGIINKILKRLLSNKCLHNKFCFANQNKILGRLLKKYPDTNFWLYADFGEPVDNLLFLLGKNEPALRKKYVDFRRTEADPSIIYITHAYPVAHIHPRMPRNPWEFYE